LPWNPQKFGAVAQDLAFNTASSFTTNTNWQNYAGEATMSYLTQMAGLACHNFMSAAVGIALAIAFVRGIARREKEAIGNFWVDMTRATLWLLLPMCIVYALALVSQGVVQNLKPYDTVKLVESQQVQKTGADGKPVVSPEGKPVMDTVTDQTIAQGPVASQEAIKMLGTNGGGFFNANSSHPFENPTPLSNYLQMLSIFVIPAGLTYTLGRMTGSQCHGWAVWAAMAFLFLCGVTTAYWAEARGNPLLKGADQQVSATQPGGNMEGKEVRFGIAGSTLTAVVTSNTATGSNNSMHDSYSSFGGLVLLTNLLLGELVFGGLGTGIYSMVMAAAIALFLAGLMVGRTPEYLGKKIGPAENKLIILYALAAPVVILSLTAIAISTKAGLAGLTTNSGPHGLSEILFAYSSGFANNGQSFAGLSANSVFYNLTTALAMMAGRFGLAIPALACAGLFARQRNTPSSVGTLRTDGLTFGIFLIVCLIVVTALSYLPSLVLGPVLEHLLFGI